MEKETKINGYRCNFINNTEEPECNFLCIPIVHDAKYVNIWATISFTPEEKETFGKRIHLLGSRMMPTDVPGQSLSVFVFTYMEDDDLEFIKKKATFFFKEKKNVLIEKDQMSTSEAPETLKLYNYGYSKLITVKLIRDYLNMRLDEAKNSIDSMSIMGYVRYDLSKLSETERLSLLKDLKSNNVKYKVK